MPSSNGQLHCFHLLGEDQHFVAGNETGPQ